MAKILFDSKVRNKNIRMESWQQIQTQLLMQIYTNQNKHNQQGLVAEQSQNELDVDLDNFNQQILPIIYFLPKESKLL